MLNDTGVAPFIQLRVALSPNARAEGIQSLLDPFVAAIDLVNVVDHALALRAERREQERHAGPDVGAGDLRTRESIAADDDGAVRVAEDDARAHLNQFVREEEPRLEHLLEDH